MVFPCPLTADAAHRKDGGAKTTPNSQRPSATVPRNPEAYLAEIERLAGYDHPIRDVIKLSSPDIQKVYHTNLETSQPTLQAVLRQNQDPVGRDSKSVCIIENINRAWMAALGSAWSIPTDFFIAHAHAPELRGADLWSDLRILHHLFLVDGPLQMEKTNEPSRLTPSKLSLWIPHSSKQGGFPLPQLYGQPQFSMLENLQRFLSYEWHMNVLFSAPSQQAIDCVELAHILAASLWWTNLRRLDREIKLIAFEDVRNPTITINNRLHECRHALNTLRSEVAHAKAHLKPRPKYSCKVDYDPSDVLRNVYYDFQHLERFLMDTFQLLMSSISVLDSQASIQDAKRSTRLLQLATLYVPLSFVTGVFGMNVREINKSPRSIWVFFVTLAGVGLFTAVLLWLARDLQKEKMNRAKAEKRELWKLRLFSKGQKRGDQRGDQRDLPA
ncbi:hypothetical protein TI39_contig293g00015 [Zymoseptoria brevis]|uniref:Uncharacterized protein n=1 Tax=Zymoseptoria brevis TaxID=1047168 RepID=A0A0F4GVW7_9PEZI|nr:hypothetical protein TI39_contig293g00015 [Zymoseptoria brevis]